MQPIHALSCRTLEPVAILCHEYARSAACSPVHRKRVAEHRPAALGLLLSRLVLDDVPMFDKHSVLNSKNVRRDPIHECSEPRKTSMDDDVVTVRQIIPGSYFSVGGRLLMRLKRPSRPPAMCAL